MEEEEGVVQQVEEQVKEAAEGEVEGLEFGDEQLDWRRSCYIFVYPPNSDDSKDARSLFVTQFTDPKEIKSLIAAEFGLSPRDRISLEVCQCVSVESVLFQQQAVFSLGNRKLDLHLILDLIRTDHL